MAQQSHNAVFLSERAEKYTCYDWKEIILWFHSQPDQNECSSLPLVLF